MFVRNTVSRLFVVDRLHVLTILTDARSLHSAQDVVLQCTLSPNSSVMVKDQGAVPGPMECLQLGSTRIGALVVLWMAVMVLMERTMYPRQISHSLYIVLSRE